MQHVIGEQTLSRLQAIMKNRPILLIQNLDALKLMVMSIREENAGNLEKSMVYEGRAVILLEEQLADTERGSDPTPQVHDPFGGGSIARIF